MHKGQEARIVIIAGGSFQGKSIIALEIATAFRFSGVVSTDMIRNVLKVLRPDEDYLSTSTYLLPEPLLLKQMREVSNVIKEMIAIYKRRGEHIVIEGMHFSEDFLRWASSQNFHKIFIDNRLSLRERVIYKNVTRSRLGLYDSVSSKRIFGTVNEANVDSSSYIKHQTRIVHIHNSMLALCTKYGFEVVEFDDIEDGIARAIDSVEKWISCNDNALGGSVTDFV